MKTKKKKAARREPKAANSSANEQSTLGYISVKDRMLAQLRTGRTLTHLDIWREFGSSRASHHVYKLRREGWPVITETQMVRTSDQGRTAIIARYRLPAEYVDKGA